MTRLSLHQALRSLLLVATAAVGLTAMGCSSSSESVSTGSDDFTSGENTDVQVISAKTYGSIVWSTNASGVDARKCKILSREPFGRSGEFTSTAKVDCTEALIASRGAVINQYIENQAWIREDPSLSYAVFRNWCAEMEVVVAVKASAWNAASFEGIGFYSQDPVINEDPSTRGVFYKKSDTHLNRIGEATLRNEGHQKVYLYKFGGAGPCTINGTGDNPNSQVEFKPYARFKGDHYRWESNDGNHSVRFRQEWNRSADLLD